MRIITTAVFFFSRLYIILEPICNIVIYFLLVLNFATVICVLSIKVKKKKKKKKKKKGNTPRGL